MKTYRMSNIKAYNFKSFLLFTAFCFFCSPAGGLDLTVSGSIGKRETAPSGPMYTGNGDSNMRLAVLAPEVQGDVPGYLPLYIQGLLYNNINKFSKIVLVDRQNISTVIDEQNLVANGRYSDNYFVKIGNSTNA
jgi:hypothetical protein